MLRRSLMSIAALSVMAVGAAACSSTSSSPSTNSSSSSTSSSTSSSSSSTSTSSSTSSTSSSSASAPASSTGSSSGGGSHGGVTLVDAPAIPTAQGTKPLVVENNPHATLEDSFNVFNSNSFGYQLNAEGMVYEPLLVFNNLKAMTAYPWLAKDFSWNSDGTQITFQLRDNVKFSDGNPMTADDVAYSFQVQKDTPALNRLGLPLKSVSADTSANTVTVTFTSPQFQNIYNVAGQTFIVEKKIYSNAGDLTKFNDPTPIGTGPYTLGKFSPQGFQFTENKNYWGGTPPVPEVDYPAYATNDVALNQLAAGNIDYAGNFVSHIQQTFVAKDPAHNHYWFPATNTVTLWFNVGESAPAGLKDPQVRQAISFGFDRTTIAQQAEQGYEAPATSSSGLLLPNFAQQVPADQKNDLPASIDKSKVDSIMTAAGYTKDSGGFWAKGGTEVKFAIEDPSAYTDYYQAAQIMASNLKSVGFNVTASGVDAGKWYTDLGAGSFDSAIHWGASSPSAYGQFYNWMDFGQVNNNNAAGDYGRYKNDAAEAALSEYASAGTDSAAQDAINKLSAIMKNEVPVTPIMYAAGWYEYNTKKYSQGWVTKDNQYIDPSPNATNCEFVVLHLAP